MKILVDAIPMTGLLTGIARYLRNLYGSMAQLPPVKISYFNGNEAVNTMPPLADSVQWQQATGAVRKLPDSLIFGLRSARWLRYEHKLNRLCKKKNNIPFDLYHETAFTPAKTTAIPTVFSIYDLSLRRYSETHPRERVWLFEHFIKTRLRYASHILTISEFIRQEIIAEFNISPAMVTAIPLAPDPLFTPCSPNHLNKIRNQYQLPEDYLLFVSSLEPRKNIDLLIDALEKVNSDIPLVLVGWQAWGEKHWLRKLKKNKFKKKVYFTGHVPDRDLQAIYTGATALIYPSHYEGFGLPILEAMACGCPVVCSNVASMPEVAGNAAVLINPKNSEDLAQAIETVVQDTDLRKTLVTQGFRQASKFTWQATAAQTLDLFKQVAK